MVLSSGRSRVSIGDDVREAIPRPNLHLLDALSQ